MILNRQIVLKAIVTPKLKEQLIAEVNEAVARVNETQDQLEVQSRRVMLELQRTDLNRAMAFRQQLDTEKKRHSDLKEELDERLQEYQALEMGTEFVRGMLEGQVDVQEGDNLLDKLSRAEILTEDDIIREIRDPAPEEGLIVGEVVGTHGLLGEVKLYPITDFPERLQRYRRLLLALPDGTRQEVRVVRARPHKNVWLLKLRGVNTPEAAEALRGAKAVVPAELAEPLPEGHYYLHQIVGLRAVTPDGEELGTVTEVLRGPANDVYVVGSLLIPAVKEIVERIDLSAGVLVVRSRDALAMEEVPPDPGGDAHHRP